jgi:nucleotide-binding universal stress UspA family protein
MQTILVATDLSPRSDRAVRRALLLARASGASLSLVHVVDDDQPRAVIEAECAAAERILADQARSLQEIDGVECAHHITTGDAFAGILQVVREGGYPLLVLGPHRRQLLRDVFVGTTAERVIRACSAPVLMANAVPAAPYRHALAAVDFSDSAMHALDVVSRIAALSKVPITIGHAFDAPETGLMKRAAVAAADIDLHVGEVKRDVTAELHARLAKTPVEPAQIITRLAQASTAAAIQAMAREVGADLVIVGTRGRTGLAKALLGSVAEAVLRNAECDVLAIPPTADTVSG